MDGTSQKFVKAINDISGAEAVAEMQEAMNGFNRLTNIIRGHEAPLEYYNIRTEKQEVLHRKAKEKRAKRKRGGKK